MHKKTSKKNPTYSIRIVRTKAMSSLSMTKDSVTIDMSKIGKDELSVLCYELSRWSKEIKRYKKKHNKIKQDKREKFSDMIRRILWPRKEEQS